jgi:hypothetical protein
MTTNNFLTNRMKIVNFTIGLFLSLNCFGQVPTFVPTAGLVGYYPFSGNAIDYSGNLNNGHVTGASLTTDRFGNSSNAYNFNGTNNYIGIKSIPFQSFSISSWIYISGVNPTNLSGIVSNYYYSPYNGFELRIDPDSSITLVCGQTNSHVHLYAGNKLNYNTWYHIVATSDNNSLKVYLNSQIIGSGNISNSQNNTPRTYFGTRDSTVSNGGYFNGKLDDIGIWNRALTPSEVTNLYNANICYQSISVTDTLIINTNITNFNPLTYQNSFKIWPNPTNDHITIDNGNISNLTGYQLKITNSLGQQVFQSAITQQQFLVDLSTWTGNGIYFVHIIDAQGNTLDIKKIILQ